MPDLGTITVEESFVPGSPILGYKLRWEAGSTGALGGMLQLGGNDIHFNGTVEQFIFISDHDYEPPNPYRLRLTGIDGGADMFCGLADAIDPSTVVRAKPVISGGPLTLNESLYLGGWGDLTGAAGFVWIYLRR